MRGCEASRIRCTTIVPARELVNELAAIDDDGFRLDRDGSTSQDLHWKFRRRYRAPFEEAVVDGQRRRLAEPFHYLATRGSVDLSVMERRRLDKNVVELRLADGIHVSGRVHAGIDEI
jgi:hypothetical protein